MCGQERQLQCLGRKRRMHAEPFIYEDKLQEELWYLQYT